MPVPMPLTSPAWWCAGSSSMLPSHLPWQGTRDPTVCGCRKSCCSKPRSAPCWATTSVSCSALPQRSGPGRCPGRRRWRCGVPGITASRAQSATAAHRRVAEHGGQFPPSAQALEKVVRHWLLHGGCDCRRFCFGERAAILDANVRRVLTVSSVLLTTQPRPAMNASCGSTPTRCCPAPTWRTAWRATPRADGWVPRCACRASRCAASARCSRCAWPTPRARPSATW